VWLRKSWVRRLTQQRHATSGNVVVRRRNLQLAFFHEPLDHRGRFGQQGRLNLGVRLSGRVQIGPGLIDCWLNMGIEGADSAQEPPHPGSSPSPRRSLHVP
jgi:hypothetical protein